MMSSWGGTNLVPSQTDPPFVLFVAGRRAIVYGPARRRAIVIGTTVVVSFEPLRVVLPREEVVLLPSVVMPRSLLVVLLSSLELPDFVSGFGTGGGAISEEGIGIVFGIGVGVVYCPCRYRTIIAALGGGSRCSIGGISYGRHGTPAVR